MQKITFHRVKFNESTYFYKMFKNKINSLDLTLCEVEELHKVDTIVLVPTLNGGVVVLKGEIATGEYNLPVWSQNRDWIISVELNKNKFMPTVFLNQFIGMQYDTVDIFKKIIKDYL